MSCDIMELHLGIGIIAHSFMLIMAHVTRSRTHSSDSGADAQPPHGPTAVVKMTARLSRTLTGLAES
ncbi:hypothetical protein ANCDUO_01573 [Ancylostoma duodenale]|uniref:Uncharacterized protein n=1 Tax=Ancylostoma duodenale TaxID=51022 RepID=A0A0C2HEX6_9BILA|nr:hypothetical protein ANCDUO_01573 [Ancylostoma duodenale]